MDNHAWPQARLADYLDRSLEPAEVVEVEEHLATCGACRVELAWITELRDRARNLPAEIAPARDLWPAIAANITAMPVISDAEVGVTDIGLRSRPRPWRWQWAAAAVLLMAISSGATAYLLRERSGAPFPSAAATEGVAARPLAGLAAFEPAEAEYRNTVEELESELAARRDRFLPETITTVDINLAIIDAAIAENRAALSANPTSADLPLLLSGVYRKKVELLRSVVDLSARS